MNASNRHQRLALLLVSLALLSACSTVTATVDVDRSADFSSIRDCAVLIGTSWNNQIGEKNAVAEFERALSAKGWQIVPENQADAVVLIHGATEKQKSLDTFYSGGYGGYYGGWGWGGGMGSSHTTVREFTVGTLVVDIYNVGTKSLMWRGIASGDLATSQSGREAQLKEAVDKLFKDFPPARG